MDIHFLIQELAELGHIEAGHGPKHLISPNVAIADEIKSFLTDYSFLKQDHDYVDFLEYYAGLGLGKPEDDLLVDIYGFTNVSSHMIELEGAIVDESGFLTFCSGTIVIRKNIGELD